MVLRRIYSKNLYLIKYFNKILFSEIFSLKNHCERLWYHQLYMILWRSSFVESNGTVKNHLNQHEFHISRTQPFFFIDKENENLIFVFWKIYPIMFFVFKFIYSFILQSKCDFYIENQFTFRKLKRELEKSAPAETLQVIQQTVDLNVCGHQYWVKPFTVWLIYILVLH